MSTPLIIRERQIKTKLSYHLTLVKMTNTKKYTNSECWRECRKKRNTTTLLVGMQFGANTIENSMHVCVVSYFRVSNSWWPYGL